MDNSRFTEMTTRPVPRLILSLAAPTILSMLVTSFYNLGDTFFVSRISTQATAAVGVSFAVMAVVQAIGFMLGSTPTILPYTEKYLGVILLGTPLMLPSREDLQS